MAAATLASVLWSAWAATSAWTVVEGPWPAETRPVAIAGGEGGSLWMVDAGAEGGLGSIWKLVDADGDRRFETATRFADGLIGPKDVLADGPSSVLVFEPPNLIRLGDTDGDGRADASRIIAKAPDATGIARGSDGWIRLLGAGLSVDPHQPRARGRRSWPFAGRAVERSDGSWVSAQGSTVIVVSADDHAIVRNPSLSAPWGTVAAKTADGEVSALVADGDAILLVEATDEAVELRRRSIAVDGPRLSLGIPEAILTFPRERPFSMTRLGDGSIAIASAEALTIASDGRAASSTAVSRSEPAGDVASLQAMMNGRVASRVAAATFAAGGLPDGDALPLFELAFAVAGADKSVRDAVVAGLAGREVDFLARVLAGSASDGLPLEAMCRSASDSVLDAEVGVVGETTIRRLVELATRLDGRPGCREAILGRVLAATEPNARLRRTLFVDLEPEGWRTLVASNASPAAIAIDPHLRWPGRADLPPLPDPDAGLDLVELGRRTYATCVTCHGSGGRGQPGIYPPLKGSDWVLGDSRRLVRIMIHGLQGPITVNGEPYASVMQLPRQLNDREIAAVLTYVRQAWGNDAVAVEESLVREIRATTSQRKTPWTSPELDEIMRGTSP